MSHRGRACVRRLGDAAEKHDECRNPARRPTTRRCGCAQQCVRTRSGTCPPTSSSTDGAARHDAPNKSPAGEQDAFAEKRRPNQFGLGDRVQSDHGRAQRASDHDRRGALSAPVRDRHDRRVPAHPAHGPGANPRRRARAAPPLRRLDRLRSQPAPPCSPGSTRRCTACPRPTGSRSTTTIPVCAGSTPIGSPRSATGSAAGTRPTTAASGTSATWSFPSPALRGSWHPTTTAG